MKSIGAFVTDPRFGKSVGVIQRVAEKGGPNRYEVRIVSPQGHHKLNDVVIWEIEG